MQSVRTIRRSYSPRQILAPALWALNISEQDQQDQPIEPRFLLPDCQSPLLKPLSYVLDWLIARLAALHQCMQLAPLLHRLIPYLKSARRSLISYL